MASYTDAVGTASVDNSGNMLYAKSTAGTLDGSMTFSGVVDTSFPRSFHQL